MLKITISNDYNMNTNVELDSLFSNAIDEDPTITFMLHCDLLRAAIFLYVDKVVEMIKEMYGGSYIFDDEQMYKIAFEHLWEKTTIEDYYEFKKMVKGEKNEEKRRH